METSADTFNIVFTSDISVRNSTHGRVLKTATLDGSEEPVNLPQRRRRGEFTIERRAVIFILLPRFSTF